MRASSQISSRWSPVWEHFMFPDDQHGVDLPRHIVGGGVAIIVEKVRDEPAAVFRSNWLRSIDGSPARTVRAGSGRVDDVRSQDRGD